MSERNVEVRLARRPQGRVRPEDFEVVETAIADPEEGEVLIRTIYLSLDPYQRILMSGRQSFALPNASDYYVEPQPVGAPMPGEIVGQVVKSRSRDLSEGAIVTGFLTWASHVTATPSLLRVVDPSIAPIATAVHALGMPGMTAYVCLFEVGQPRPGETVFVSSAAGTVGMLAGQLAKIAGCRVVGSTSSPRKAQRCLDNGYDAVINYTRADIDEQLANACPDGIDVYFDNVGGSFSDAVFRQLNDHGRVAVCGTMGDYEDPTEPTGPRREWPLVVKRARMEGFYADDHLHRGDEISRQMARWLRDGKVRYFERVVDGLENAPIEFARLFTGDLDGKLVVAVSPDPTASTAGQDIQAA